MRHRILGPGRPAIAIVGAGPAGLIIAHLLQRAAIPCVVLERHTLEDLGQHPKAGLIEYRTVASLQRERIAGPILEFSAENHRCEFRTTRESVVLDMNLAIQDAVELAHGLIDRFGPKNDNQRISAYSQTRLPLIWRTEAFSNWFLRVANAYAGAAPGLDGSPSVDVCSWNGTRSSRPLTRCWRTAAPWWSKAAPGSARPRS
jgi:2-polyprenyl-6-methoxyphenol hydroxylase-like FAD-dependent oxidoreductase